MPDGKSISKNFSAVTAYLKLTLPNISPRVPSEKTWENLQLQYRFKMPSGLKNNKAAGPDGIPDEILKEAFVRGLYRPDKGF